MTMKLLTIQQVREAVHEARIEQPELHKNEELHLFTNDKSAQRESAGVDIEVQWMTAGSGVIHNEDVKTKGSVRLLQLWLTLPKNERWTAPAFQAIHSDSIPVRHEPGAEIRLYSGSSHGVQSGTRNRVPVTMVEINLEPRAFAEQELPASYNAFAFVIDGSVQIGDTVLKAGQVGWLDRPNDNATSVLRVVAGESGARLIFYAGQPQRDPIVSYGPFIGDSKQDIARLFAEYQAGGFPRLSELRKQQDLSTRN